MAARTKIVMAGLASSQTRKFIAAASAILPYLLAIATIRSDESMNKRGASDGGKDENRDGGPRIVPDPKVHRRGKRHPALSSRNRDDPIGRINEQARSQ